MRRIKTSAFFMFLKQVFKYRKWLFVIMALFIIMQLMVNFKRGVVLSPFYHFGMYSQKMKIKDTYEVWEISVNGKLLIAADFTPQKWDKIILPLDYFEGIKTKSNALYHAEIIRLLSALKLHPKSNYFIQNCNYSQFKNWYIDYLQQITHLNPEEINVQKRWYRFSKNQLLPTDSVTTLQQLCL